MKNLTDDNIRDLTERARAIRESIVEMLLVAVSGHTA